MQGERGKTVSCTAKTLTTASKFYTYLNSLLIIYPKRRLGIWRRVFDDGGNSRKCFVSILGDSVLEPECFGVAKRELSILGENGVSQRGRSSSLSNILDLKLFSDLKGNDMHSLSYWYIPNSVRHQYSQNYHVDRLADWQVHALSQILTSAVLESELSLGDVHEKVPQTSGPSGSSSYMIISPNASENLTICEVVALNYLLYSGGNVLAIFPSPQKCDSYYQRCKSLFGGSSLNLRIELFGQSSRPISNHWFPNIDLTICTPEKANTLINRLIFDNMLTECIQTVIIDDVNLIGSSTKGYLLESILAKITYINSVHASHPSGSLKSGPITCLYVSNTSIPNLQAYRDALQVGQVFESQQAQSEHSPDVYIKRNSSIYLWNQRSLSKSLRTAHHFEISETFKTGSNHSNVQQVAMSDLRYFSNLILESIIHDRKVLVFCPTIEWCRKSFQAVSMEISDFVLNQGRATLGPESRLKDRGSRVKIVEKLRAVSKSGCLEGDHQLLDGILNYGISIHNSKLTFKERKVIEEAYKENHLNVLFCTSLHMIDPEIKADRIIIRSIGLGKINHLIKNKTGNREWISKTALQQFFGRLNHSNSVLFTKTQNHIPNDVSIISHVDNRFREGIFIFTCDDAELSHLDHLLNDHDLERQDFRSQLIELNLFRLILELFLTGLVRDVSSLELVISRATFRGGNSRSEFRSIREILRGDYQRALEGGQGVGLGEDILLSLSFLMVNQLIFFGSGRDCSSGSGFSLPNTYISQPQDWFGHLKSPIVSSKYALIGSKTKDQLNKSISSIILRQNDFLAKLGSGRKYLLSSLSGILDCVDSGQVLGTGLAAALVQSHLHPCILLEIHSELFKSKMIGVNLSNCLQVFILGLLAYNGSHLKVSWSNYLQIFSDLTSEEVEIADLYGVNFKTISEIAKTMTSNPGVIPDLSQLSPISIQLSYFYSETINFKGLVEKYRLVSIYRLYHACLLRDLCNPMITFDIIMAKYSIDSSAIKVIIGLFSQSISTVSGLCKLIGWIELGDVILNIKSHLESSISIRNVKYLYKVVQEQQNHSKGPPSASLGTNHISGGQYAPENHHLDEQDISRITNYVNSLASISHHITPNIAISLYFSGLCCIEHIATASTEAILKSLQNASKLDDYFSQFTYKPAMPNLNLTAVSQEIIQQAKMALSQLDDHNDLDSISNSDIYIDQNDADLDPHSFDLELAQGLDEIITNPQVLA
ncbi:putative helicase [Cryptosporidium canis]|uniref:Helicase n=1 Tax=Cryptosporidium canis TaxID=195482 RepID=A0ABQ8PBS7_9CRYT|nr:putative helicase [Cryptosporidium canis]KAJ1615423.1 putative helicase [Cryptosporidium canis]